MFQPALDEHDWLTCRTRYLEIDTPERTAAVAAINPPLEKKLRKNQAAQRLAQQQLHVALLRYHYPDLTDADIDATLEALGIADNNRSLPQRLLVEKLQLARLIPRNRQPASVIAAMAAVDKLEQQSEDIRRQLEPSLRIRALWDRGRPSPTYILRRGEHDRPGQRVTAGVPAVLTDDSYSFVATPPFPNGTPKTGRRLALARWLVRPDHPLTARVFVNRVWYHHFGSGIVRTLDNFGTQSEPPSHPKLLDWLAVTFVRSGWNIKALHRRIMTSQTYRQQSSITASAKRLDPDNRLLSRMPLRRLDAEALRDSLLAVADVLEFTPGGLPDQVTVDNDGLVEAAPWPSGRWRRSIYLQFRRTELPSLLTTFDYPVMGPNCVQRTVSHISPQGLMLQNGRRVYQLARATACRIEKMAATPAERIRLAWRLIACRDPDPIEQRHCSQAVERIADLSTAPDDAGRQRQALTTLCHTLLNSSAFLYVD